MLINNFRKQYLKKLVNKKIQENKMTRYTFHVTFDKEGHVVSQDFYVKGGNSITTGGITYNIHETNWMDIVKENGW